MTVVVKCAVTASPTYYFHPLALTTGMIWSFGNILTSTIFKCIGMALGMSIWCSTQLIVGWSTGKWGLLGTPKDTTVQIQWLNYLGVVLVFVSLLLFFMVKPDNIDSAEKDKRNNLDIPYLEGSDSPHHGAVNYLNGSKERHSDPLHDLRHEFGGQQQSGSWIDRLTQCQRTSLGITLSVIAGLCYGSMFSPIQSMIDHHQHSHQYSDSMIDYVFTVYNGILLGALLYFTIYNISMRNKPFINTHSMFPSMVSGVGWAIAMTCYFTALDKNDLGVETTFPIVSAGPMIISSLWGVLYYKEIKGKRNVVYMTCAILTSILAVIAVSLSKFNL